MLTDFQNSFTYRLSDKFARSSFKYSTTSEICHYLVQYECLNWRQSEICIVINDKSKSNIAKYLSYDGLLHCKFIIQFVNERTSKIGQHVAKLQAK